MFKKFIRYMKNLFKRNIRVVGRRLGVFETNSSSTHSLVLSMDSDMSRSKNIISKEEVEKASMKIDGYGTLNTWVEKFLYVAYDRFYNMVMRKLGAYYGEDDYCHSYIDLINDSSIRDPHITDDESGYTKLYLILKYIGMFEDYMENLFKIVNEYTQVEQTELKELLTPQHYIYFLQNSLDTQAIDFTEDLESIDITDESDVFLRDFIFDNNIIVVLQDSDSYLSYSDYTGSDVHGEYARLVEADYEFNDEESKLLLKDSRYKSLREFHEALKKARGWK